MHPPLVVLKNEELPAPSSQLHTLTRWTQTGHWSLGATHALVGEVNLIFSLEPKMAFVKAMEIQ